jgi:hypothetical protein
MRINKFTSILAASLMIFNSSLSFAQTNNNEEKMAPLTINQPAPFTGILLSPAAVARIVVDSESVPERIKTEVEHAVGEQKARDDANLNSCQINLDTANQTSKVKIDSCNKDVNDLTKKLKDVENTNNHNTLFFGLGAGSGILLTVLTVFLVSKLSK